MKKFIILLCFLQFALCADFMSFSYSFTAGQLISAAKIMSNYNALRNAMIDGSKKINVAELWINGTRIIDNSGNVSSSAGTFTSMTATTAVITNGTTTTSNITLLRLVPTTVTPSAAITGNVFCDGVGTVWAYDGAAWHSLW
jgi:hypothetical protein